MDDNQTKSVLRCKIQTVEAPVIMTAERALPMALQRAAEAVGLPLRLAGLSETRMTLAELPEALAEQSLLAVIEGPGEALGLVALPPPTLSALVEVQTLGRIARQPPPVRRPTRIDAAMVAGFIDAVLGQIELALAPTDEIVWAGGYRYASPIDGPRPLGLLLEDVAYRVWRAELVLGAGEGRGGGFLWAIPAEGRGVAPPRPDLRATPRAADPASAAQAFAWERGLEATVMGATVELGAVLNRTTLPLAAVSRFAAGTEIPIPRESLERIRIEGGGRRLLGWASLGQFRGMRALRLREGEAGALPEASVPTAEAFEAGATPQRSVPRPPEAEAPVPRRLATG